MLTSSSVSPTRLLQNYLRPEIPRVLLLAVLLSATHRRITWNDQAIGAPAAFFVPPRAAFVPQVPRLFSESLRDNVLLGLSEGSVDLADAVASAALETDLAALPAGLNTPVGRRGATLSGGQVQRMAAARAQVRLPELLVIDDLSSALDVDTEETLWSNLATHEGRTYLVISHRPAVIRRADHIVILRDGRVEREGTLEDLLATSEEIKSLMQSAPAALDARSFLT